MTIKKKPPIIFFFKGIFPSYAYDSLKINSSNVDNKIILICDKATINKKKIKKNIMIYDYKKFNLDLKKIKIKNKNILNFREGFWIRTIERYFIIYNFCKFYKIEKFFHVELDNIITNLNGLDQKLDRYKNKIFYSKVGTLGFGNFIYINSLNALKIFCEYSSKILARKFINDMKLLYLFSKKFSSRVKHLPTIENCYKKNINNAIDINFIGGIFDSLQIGTFLFGPDPRNHCNTVNSLSSYYQTKNTFNILNYNKYFFTLKKFLLIKNNHKIKIFNVHVHSKLIKKIFLRGKYKKIIYNANNNLPTIIDFNFKNIIKIFFLHFELKRFLRFFHRSKWRGL